jgi:hypothetical protein
VISTHSGFTSFQSFHTPASSTSDGYEPYHWNRPILFSSSLALAFVLPVTPQSQIVSLAVGVDDVNLNKAIPSAGRTQGILYLGQNWRRGIGRICIRRPLCHDVVGMGRGSGEWAHCWKRVALFTLLTLWPGGRRGFCLDAVPHETIRKTAILSLSTVARYIFASRYCL